MNLCLNCRRRLLTCVCPWLKPFATNSRFIILMHPMEYKKEKVGTGRFSHLILKNSEIVVDVAFDENPRYQELLNDASYETFLLYPGLASINLSTAAACQFSPKKKQFIVIDGTWPCAKKMVKLTPSLHELPRVSFSSQRLSEFKVKQQPLPVCLSTVESIHQVMVELNRLGIEATGEGHENLMQVFHKTVEQQMALAEEPGRQGYRRRPLSLPEERKISKKWEGRSLFFRSLSE